MARSTVVGRALADRRWATDVRYLIILTLAACGGASSLPSTVERSEETSPSAVACSAKTVALNDLRADFRDIWAGREVAATGKQADPDATVTLDFGTTVDPSLVAGSYVPIETDGRCGSVVPSALTSATLAAAIWGTTTSDATRPTTPGPYNVLIRDDIQGVVSAGGPIAAGRDVTLSNFSVNGTAKQPFGFIAGGRVALTNGTVTGDLSYGVASTIPQGVTVTGRRSVQPFAVDAAFADLQSLARLLGQQAATGTVTSVSGGLKLAGNRTGLNVFRVAAEALRSATSLQIVVPTGAAALVQVTGGTVDIDNKGFTVQGAAANRILWNLAEAQFVHVTGVTLAGSILAPRAHLTFDSGSIAGTLVARGFTSSGSGTLQHTPLNVGALFGPGTPSAVALKAATPLVRGCGYTFSLPDTSGVTAAGGCLTAPVSVNFRVATSPAAAAGRELVSVESDPATRTLRRFSARSGINTRVEDALARYETSLGMAASELVAAGTSRPSSTRRGQVVTSYQQYAQGYPVVGYGYFIATQDGLLRSANGKITPRLPPFPPAALSSAAALQAALSFLKINQAPWVATPSKYQAPVGRLVVMPKRTNPTTADFALAWSFPLGGKTGIGEPGAIVIDAATGAVLVANPGMQQVATFDPASYTYVDQISSAVDTVYNGARTFPAARYRNGAGATVATLASGAVTGDGVLATVTGVSIDARGFIQGKPTYVVDPTPGTPWTTTETVEQRMASVQWALGQANTFLKSLALDFNGTPWTTIDGLGHQKVLVNYIDPGSGIFEGFYAPSQSNADVAQIVFNTVAPALPVEPDSVSHEYGHALLDNIRRGEGLGHLANYKESGALDEGIADIFAVAFNHKQVSSPSWWCFHRLDSKDPGKGLKCLEDTRNPPFSLLRMPGATDPGQPERYGDPFFHDSSADDVRNCTSANDYCGVHFNSTIVSHWGYLLGAGSASVAGEIPCGLEIVPLDADIDTSYKMVLHIALLAAGTRLGQGSKDLLFESSFADFRDATLQVVEDLVAEGVYPEDVIGKVALAWAAVGLPPATGGRTKAVPADTDASGLYPWTTFLWPQSGEGQTSSSWDYQIANSPWFPAEDPLNCVAPELGICTYERTEITDAVDQGGLLMASLPLALPFNSPKTFYWRVRPHANTKWLNCYPVHSFVGTTEPPEVGNPHVLDELTPDLETVYPGRIQVRWEIIPEARKYRVKVGTQDIPACDSPADVETTIYGPQGYVQGLLPERPYTMSVQPVGPNGFDAKPSHGQKCARALFQTARMRPPVVPPESAFATPYGYTPMLEWGAKDGSMQYSLQFYELDAEYKCTTVPAGDPIIIDDSGTGQGRGYNGASLVVDMFTPPNGDGYCWDIAGIAADGTTGDRSEPHRIAFSDKALCVSPGAGDFTVTTDPGEPSRAYPVARLPVTPSDKQNYGDDVTMTWKAVSPPHPVLKYVIRGGRFPWFSDANHLAMPDPSNCLLYSGCEYSPQNVFNAEVGGDMTTVVVKDGAASKGRTCWAVWPVLSDPANPMAAWAHQPKLSVKPFCYTSSPSLPEIHVSDGPGYSTDPKKPPGPLTSSDPIKGRIDLDYVPDAQVKISMSVNGTVVKTGDGSLCTQTEGQFQDIYDCKISFDVPAVKNTTYTVEVRTFNSDAEEPQMDDDSEVDHVTTTIKTGDCGAEGKACCAGDVCNDGTLACDDKVCRRCGGRGQVCCATAECTSKEDACLNDCSGTSRHCQQCGKQGQLCCPNRSPTCDIGQDPCVDGICNPRKDQPVLCGGGGSQSCSNPLPAPSLPKAPLDLQGAAGCSDIADLEARVNCLKNGGPASDICQYFAPSLTCAVGWPAVPGADHYEMKVFSLGLISTIPVPGGSGQIGVSMPIGAVPLAGTSAVCGLHGYGVTVTAVDASGCRGATAIAGIGCPVL